MPEADPIAASANSEGADAPQPAPTRDDSRPSGSQVAEDANESTTNESPDDYGVVAESTDDGTITRVPRWERWVIQCDLKSQAAYAAWLDQYGIRLGVIGRDNKLHMAWDFTKGIKTETAESVDYNPWGRTVPADGPMPELTQQLARKAGISQYGRYTLLFHPFDPVERLLYTLENAANKFKDPNKIRETVFTVVESGGGYKFEVIDQKYF